MTFEGDVDDLVFMLIPAGYSQAMVEILPLPTPDFSGSARDEKFFTIVTIVA